MSIDNSIGVYIHIPFCKSKCYYCDFNSYSGRDILAGDYFDALYKEIELRGAVTGGRRTRTIFIGGGTPSLVEPRYISDLMETCSRHLQPDKDAEVSMESNPGTLSYEKLKTYKAAGINRISIGLQAWQDHLLKSIGRIHDRHQFAENLDAAVRAGFENINVDLIFGLPGQTFEDWAQTIEEVAGLSPVKHISCYSLKIEEGTVLGDRLAAGTLQPADDELDRRMYHYAVEALAAKGYRQYEISNFAVPGYECRHNLIYWKAREYAGFGAGAHSYLNSVRFSNAVGIEEYIKAVADVYRRGEYIAPAAHLINGPDEVCGQSGVYGVSDASGAVRTGSAGTFPGNCGLHQEFDVIGLSEAMSEYMILGLRLNEGISSAEFRERFGADLKEIYGDKLDKLVKRGLIAADMANEGEHTSKYRLTSLGSDIANSVFIEFI